MSEGEGGSVTCWLGDSGEGDLAAAQPLWERYFSRLVVVARGKLKRLRRSTADEDEEDAALSAFNSFCGGAARGRFPQLADRDDLWRLLVVITARKAMAQAHEKAKEARWRPGRGRGGPLRAGFRRRGFDGGTGADRRGRPFAEFAAMMAEECQRLLDSLDDDSLRQVALSRMEGYTNDEIADQLGSRRTIARRLDLIRKTWMSVVEVG